MGLLDEAIRQHLELKRQHGASDEELQQQEQEALGPVRREPVEPAAPDEPEPEHDEALAGDEAPYDEPSLATVGDAPVYDEAPIELAEEAPMELAEEAPLESSRDDFAEPLDPYAPSLPGETDAATETLAPDLEPEPGVTGDTPTQGFEAVPEPPAGDYPLEDEEEPGADDDDVLEETPEFLQETPEHDRLWFEQRPPRDFDFDE